MFNSVKRHWIQIVLVLLVFAVFILNAAGLFELLLEFGEGSPNFAVVARSPEFLVLLAIGLVLSIALPMIGPIHASILTFLCMGPIFYMEYLPSPTRSLVPLEYSLLTVLMLFVVNVLISYFSENQKKQKLIQAFAHYVPPQVASQIGRNPDAYNLEGEAKELTVMFCDVHNFTGIAEQIGPKQLAEILNTLFTPLTEVLYKHHATIDKYIGDAIMAFWGAPINDPDHAQHALSAALEMQEVVKKLAPVFERRGWPALTLGIGINTGVVSVGNMGSKYRMAYTAIGDAVNLAARVQELTRFYKSEIIVGENTRKAFPLAAYRELGLVRVKGKNDLARIYEPTNPKADPESTMVENMHRHNKALRHYYNREWDDALRLFESLLARRPDDPLYPYFIDRIAEFRTNPPPADWRGQVEFTVK